MVSASTICGVAAAFSMLAVMPIQADTTLKIQGSDGLNTSIQISNGKGRIGGDGRGDYLLYDSATKIITYVEPEAQQYTQLTTAELDAMALAAANVKEAVTPYMAGMLAGLPQEQRKEIEQRMGAMLAAPAASKPVDIRIVREGEQSIAGLQCQVSSLLKNGVAVAKVCMATAASGKLSAQDFVTLETLVTLSRSMADSASGLMGGAGSQVELLTVELEGVPISAQDLANGTKYQVTSVSNDALPEVLFNDYGNFQKQGVQNLFR